MQHSVAEQFALAATCEVTYSPTRDRRVTTCADASVVAVVSCRHVAVWRITGELTRRTLLPLLEDEFEPTRKTCAPPPLGRWPLGVPKEWYS